MQKSHKLNKQLLRNLPETAGVYIFKNSDKKPIYVGKAKVLRNRVKSYFVNNLLNKTARMMHEAKYISLIKVASEFEALLLEATLVKKYQPHYNSALKDDKSPLYIGITKEEYPRVLLLRRSQLQNQKLKKYYGPFLRATTVKGVLKMLRRIFPYSDHKIGKRGCFYSHIGYCNPCPSMFTHLNDVAQVAEHKNNYFKNITRLTNTLNGKLSMVRRSLVREMQALAKSERFEEANVVKRKVNMIDYITTPHVDTSGYLKNPNLIEDIRDKEVGDLKKIIVKHIDVKSLKRIECFDISHLSGNFPTASMVTFIDGEADNSLYRHFKMTTKKRNSDVDMMAEVIKRRLKYLDGWGKPDLIIVDGGKPQVSAAVDILKNQIPVVGLAKRHETIVFKVGDGFKEARVPEGPALNLVQRLRDESHRFARRLHHKLVSKALVS